MIAGAASPTAETTAKKIEAAASVFLRRDDMPHKQVVLALGMLVVAAPRPASQPDPYAAPAMAAPAGAPDTKYCLRTEPITGTRIPVIECLTRAEWADGDVDVDEAWAKDGVKIVA
jgi:hypothetical protein